MTPASELLLKQLYQLSGHTVRAHPNGFVQVDLAPATTEHGLRGHSGGSKRLHVWHPRVPRQEQGSPIHDHAFDMRSTVLLGELCQVRIDVKLDRLEADSEVLVAEYGKAHDSQLKHTNVFVYTGDRGYRWVGAGETYTQRAATFHESRPGGGTVATLMEKLETYPHSPRVLIERGKEPENSFDRSSHDKWMLWAIVEDAVKLMSQEHRSRLDSEVASAVLKARLP